VGGTGWAAGACVRSRCCTSYWVRAWEARNVPMSVVSCSTCCWVWWRLAAKCRLSFRRSSRSTLAGEAPGEEGALVGCWSCSGGERWLLLLGVGGSRCGWRAHQLENRTSGRGSGILQRRSAGRSGVVVVKSNCPAKMGAMRVGEWKLGDDGVRTLVRAAGSIPGRAVVTEGGSGTSGS
jgi:hypothetical protein